MIKKLKLGIVYNKEDQIINHRSLIKVILNPFLRLIGFNIGTRFMNGKLYGISLTRCSRKKSLSFKYDVTDISKIERKRILI